MKETVLKCRETDQQSPHQCTCKGEYLVLVLAELSRSVASRRSKKKNWPQKNAESRSSARPMCKR